MRSGRVTDVPLFIGRIMVINTSYEDLLRDVLENGEHSENRTDIPARGVFGRQIRFNLSEGFPLVTTKRVFLRGVIEELLWLLRGETNSRSLQAKGVKIWDEWADENGDLGPIYGKQWRSWEGANGRTVDQISEVVEQIKTNPNSRRLVVSAWNPAEIPDMALAPCHALFQFRVVNGKLSCQLYQRSADMFLGVPFNIASYALLTIMIAQQTGLELGDFIWTGGDCHIYDNLVEQVELQLTREAYDMPKITFARTPDSLFDYTYEDFVLEGYVSHPAIKGEVAI